MSSKNSVPLSNKFEKLICYIRTCNYAHKLKVSHSKGTIICLIWEAHVNPFIYVCVSCSAVSDSLQPHGLWPARPLCPWNSPGKNTGVDCHSILQGILLTQYQTHVSYTARRFFTIWATREAFHLFIQLILQPWRESESLLQLDVNKIFSVFLSSDLNQSLWNAGLEIKYLLKKRYLSWAWKPQKLIRQHYIQDKGNNKCRDAKARSIWQLRLVPYSGKQEHMREAGCRRWGCRGRQGPGREGLC